MGCVPVGLRPFRDPEIDIGDGDLHVDLSTLALFAVLQLVEVHGIIIVYGRPEEGTQVPGTLPRYSAAIRLDGPDLPEDRARVVRTETVLLHDIPGNGLEVNRDPASFFAGSSHDK